MPNLSFPVSYEDQRSLAVNVYIPLKADLWEHHEVDLSWEDFLAATFKLLVQDFIKYDELRLFLATLILSEK